jgi:lipoate-protein ligase A
MWSFIVTPACSGAENMALDEALMVRARETGMWTMRLYTWSRPTISFGRNQTARGRYDIDRIRALGLDVVRRPTGGRAILHDREITYSVTAPVDGAGSLRESYHRINQLLLLALRTVGADAAISTDGRASAPGVAPCFAEPAPGELVVDGRKLAGSAQWRTEGALLQHGSILVDDDQTVLATLSAASEPPVAVPRPATLRDALGRAPLVAEAAAALRDAIRAREGVEPAELCLDNELRARTSALVVRYLDDRWTWRR